MSEPETAAEAPEQSQAPARSITFTGRQESPPADAGEQETPAKVEKVDETEVQAIKNGWVSKAEWTEKGNNPEDWISAKNFLINGDLIRRVRRSQDKEREFDQRLADNNAFWRAKLEQDKKDLQAERGEQIDLANRPEVEQIDKKIEVVDEQLAKLEQTAAPQVTAEDAQYETEWFNQNKADLTTNQAKLLLTQNIFDQCKAHGLSGKDMCDEIDAALLANFPPTNPNRQAAPVTDNKGSRNKQSDDEHRVDSLTIGDKKTLAAMRRTSPRFAKMTDSQLLKVMKDSTK